MKQVWIMPLLLALFFTPGQTWERIFGGKGIEVGYSGQQTSDGGYIAVGETNSFGSDIDVYLIKTDADGNALWTRTFGGSKKDWGYSVQQTSDGGYIIVGATESFGPGYRAVYLIKTNATGDTIWTKTYGRGTVDCGVSVRQTSDGGYIITGSTEFSNPDSEDINVYLIKTDPKGDTIWTKNYGGIDYDWGRSVRQTSDGGYIIVGLTYSFGAGVDNVYLLKTDASGDTVWTKNYGGNYLDEGYCVQQAFDGSYILVGMTTSVDSGEGDVLLIKTDASGNLNWNKTYDGACGFSVEQTSDGGYIIAGGGVEDGAHLIKINATGDSLWGKVYGGANQATAYSVQQTLDGGYFITGHTKSFGAGGPDVYLIKTDSLGESGVEENRKPKSTPGHTLKIQSPCHGNLNLSFFLPASSHTTIELYDIAGEKVGTLTDGERPAGWHRLTSKLSVPAGVYFVKLSTTPDNSAITRKIILLK